MEINQIKLFKISMNKAVEEGDIIVLPIIEPTFEIAIKEMELNIKYQTQLNQWRYKNGKRN